MLQSMRSAAKYIWIIIVVFFVGGFLLVQTSGLLGRAPVTPTTAVAKVNGTEITYQQWMATTQNLIQSQEQRLGRSITLDERQQLENDAFNQLVEDILLQQELRKRGIRVSDEEIIDAARSAPPPSLMQSPELQTDGRFDFQKYQRFLNSPAARSGGILAQLEAYYRDQIPKQKLFEQVAAEVWVTDDQLWRTYRDTHDSAQVSYVAFDTASARGPAPTVSDAEIRAYYEKHAKEFERPARAWVSVLAIPRTITAADTAAARTHALALRDEILKGAKFEDVARRESADTVSAAQGGELPRGVRGRFVPEFENAAYALKPGELSEPVLSPFGFHIIRVDEHKGDTLAVRHILVRIQQSDSSASRTDKLADRLAGLAASATDAKKFDEAAKTLTLTPVRGEAEEGEPLTIGGRTIPSVSAWAFGGAKPGESSELFSEDDAYYLARLDSLSEGGKQPLDRVTSEIRATLLREKKLEAVVPAARQFAQAASTSTLEAAAKAQGLAVKQTGVFSRVDRNTGGLEPLSEAVGAAFSLPVGVVSAPITTRTAVYVLRVDRRVPTDRAEWEKQKAAQRAQMLQLLRQQRVRTFMQTLRETADVKDYRKKLNAAARREA